VTVLRLIHLTIARWDGQPRPVQCDDCDRRMLLPWLIARRLGWCAGGWVGWYDLCPRCYSQRRA
jgi:hypothetical protein